MTTFLCNIIEDPNNPDELLLDLGLDLCAQLGLQPGDTVEWINNQDGTWTLKNKTPTSVLTP
jgi:hypothetical protein